MSTNCRYANGNKRRKYRGRFKAMNAPCGICKGTLGAIHYDEPSSHNFPLSFVIDEIIPVSRAVDFGYTTPREAAEDWNNLQAAHYCCNQMKSNKLNFNYSSNTDVNSKNKLISISDGDW